MKTTEWLWTFVLAAASNNNDDNKSFSSSSFLPPSHLFIGGLGYCGLRIAKRFWNEFPNCKISGTVRSLERKESLLELYSDWLHVHVLDLDETYSGLNDNGVADLRNASHIIQTIAPIADFNKDPLLSLHSSSIVGSTTNPSNRNNKNENNHLPRRLQWIGYLSSTGVYGDHNGDWVTETSPLYCTDQKSLARVQAEKDWCVLENSNNGNDETGIRVDCFRCGGIYGPGRSLLTVVGNEPPVDQNKPDDATIPKYVNRIMVQDICGALVAAVSSNRPLNSGRIYNLVDDEPAPRSDVAQEARRLLGLVPPPTENNPPIDVSSGDQTSTTATGNKDVFTTSRRRRPTSRNTGNKRCRNQRLKEEYTWKLIAPTYREGLAYLMNTANSEE